MSHVHVLARQQIACPANIVFELVKDSEALGKAAGMPMKRIADGVERDGPGTVRRIGPPVIGVEETIIEVVADKLVRYRITRNGGPIRAHQAEMRLSSRGDGTELAWIMDFEMPWPLSAVASRMLPMVARQALRRLARELEGRFPGASSALV